MIDDEHNATPPQDGASGAGWHPGQSPEYSADDLEHPIEGEPVIEQFFYLPPALDVVRGNTEFVTPKFYNFITWRGQTRYMPEDYEAYKDVWDAWEQSESVHGPRVWEAYSAYMATPKEPEPPEHETPED